MKQILVVGHQPQLFPYVGILNKISKADIFIIVDHVQFVRKYFYNRTYIKVNGNEHLLTVPVVSKGQYQRPINEIQINRNQFRPEKHLRTLRSGYAKAPYFDRYFPRIEEIFRKEHVQLVGLTCELLEFCLKEFRLVRDVRYSSRLGVAGKRTQLLVELTRAVGGTSYLSGEGARNYFEPELFSASGLRHFFNEFEHPIYPQIGSNFIARMGCIDLLFNCGTEGREYIVNPERYLEPEERS